MSTSRSAESVQHPHLDHLFKVGVLVSRSQDKRLSPATRLEAAAELLRYRNEGLILQKYPKENKVTKKTRAHADPVYSGRGIIFAVIDDREAMREGKVTTIDVITDAIEAALDAGYETSEEIARYITTSAFQHVTDKRVRFNSVLKAGDVVGAQITRKLYNSYNELAKMADEEDDPKAKADLRNEARGFAEAIQIVISPFSSEDPKDPRLVNWDEVDRMTEAFEKEQRAVRRERKGNPQ
ncbi:hypothetical protein HOV00_gp50 [Microbacterium phage Schubert]|uniref:Uncharacterized protein n=1 Tax=Microbacterium phage Schubert TaxID=2500787 RepID=A0A3Q9RAB0_9CAUD|nr:hypothetical protein HOV00_gp50 [Microbacterium phage Schubert]AZV01749.1 hypothetical protein SEA_SCHUBERT_43 [Microbacterium phage Schubert]